MSSKDVLSEGELDALMETFSEEDAPMNDPAFQKSCEPFDFSTRDQNFVAQLPALKNLNEKFALALGPAIRKLYGFTAQIDSAEAQPQTLEAVFAEVNAPLGINILRIAPLTGSCYVLLPGELLSFVVDRYFGGGSGKAGAKAAARTSLTHSEQRVNDALRENFLATLSDTWHDKVQLSPSLTAFESSTDFLQLPDPGEQVISFPFTLQVGEWSTTIEWVVPSSALEQLRPKLGNQALAEQPAAKNTDWERHFLRELQQVTLELSGAFQSESVSIADVLSLKAGTIVPLKMPTEVLVSIEGEPMSIGEHGVLNGHKSIKIKRMLGSEA